MDFFDLKSTPVPSQKVQRFGKKMVEQYHAREFEHEDFNAMPDMSLQRRDDIFLRPLEEYNIQPEQQDVNGLQSYFDHDFQPPDLPIMQYRQEIIDTVRNNMVTIITAPTGSGKSTQVPQYVLDYEYSQGRHCKIVVTQPRRVAAISLANRVLSERNLPSLMNNDNQGTLVGYQIGMDRKVNEDTRIIYMTTGVLLRKIISAQSLGEFTHIVLDEVHERDKDTDFLLLLIKKLLCTTSHHNVRLIIMSATVDARKFARYFQTTYPEQGIPCPAPIIAIQEQMFNVSIFYLEEIQRSLGQPSGQSGEYKEPLIEEKLYKLAKDLINKFDEVDKLDNPEGTRHSFRGSVLVFLPGIFEIESLQRILKSDKAGDTYDIICLHSTIPKQYQMRVFDKPEEGKRKVILSTNIAESSITVPDIKYVVDFCLSKELHADSGTGMSSLRYVWAPKSSLDQRKGRAGRVSRGKCYRLIKKTFLEELSDFTTPEMQRCSVEQLILWCKILNIGDPEEILSYALDPPDLNKLREGALLLLEVGALVLPKGFIDNPLDQPLTFLGHMMGSLPLDVRLARLIMFGLVFDCLGEAVIMAACLSLPAFLEVPYNNKDQKLKSYVARMKKAKGTFSDPVMMLNVYTEWFDIMYKHEDRNNVNGARKYCQQNFVNFNRIQEVAALIQDIYSCLKRMNIPECLSEKRQTSYSGQGDQFDLIFRMKLALAGANYPYFFVQNKHHLDRENCMRTFGAKSPADTVMFTGMRLEVSSQAELERKYKQDMNNHFRDVYDPIKRLTLESNRLYVTFDMVKEANTSKSVYYALKTKQIGETLTLRSKQDSNRPVQSAVTFDLPADPDYPIPVTVTYVESPTKFFVQIRMPDIRGNFQDLNEAMQTLPRERVPVKHLDDSSYGMTTFDNDGSMYRVKAVKVDENYNVKVHYVDYGNSLWINANTFYYLPEDFLTGCPFQAVECSIEGICPNISGRSLSSVDKWERRFVDGELRPILENKQFIAKIQYLLNSILNVDLIDPVTGTSVKGYLLNSGKVSQAAADYRTEYAKMMLGQPEVQLQTVTIPEPLPDRERANETYAKLSGPTSPYEVEHTGLTDSAKSYRTVVDSNSVCSIIICPNPQDDFTELITASSVALSSSGCRIQLRGVTQHHPIKGFPDMMVLLFAPKVQLHTSASRLNYVGCVAGLGLGVNSEPLWPDHDLQVTFDHRILESDIVAINKLRMLTSTILEADDDDPSKFKYTVETIRKRQWEIKTGLRALREGIASRSRLTPPHEATTYTWRPANMTFNSQEAYEGSTKNYLGQDDDMLRPHSSLVFIHEEKYLNLESRKMRHRVKGLQEHVYKLNETTGVHSRELEECKLCNMRFDRARELRNHIDSTALHVTERKRLDYWTCPKS